MKDILVINAVKSDLYKRDLYTTEEYEYIIGKRIVEYDIHDAGFNLTKYFKLLSDRELDFLSSLPKKARHITIGSYMRDNSEYNEQLTKSFRLIRRKFFKENDLDDDDIVSIKKDAIFVIGKRCKKCKFKNVEFVEKNVYTSFHKFGNIECYYNSKDDILDIKGINNDLLHLHSSFINVLKRIFRLIEIGTHDDFVKFMKRFTSDYKNKRLSYNYYREFNSNSCFSIIKKKNDLEKNFTLGLPGMCSEIDSDMDISYNYINIILPIMQRFYFKDLRK